MSYEQLHSIAEMDLPQGFEITTNTDRELVIHGPRKGEYLAIKEMGTSPKYSCTHRERYYDKTRLSDPTNREVKSTWRKATEWIQERINEHSDRY